MKKIALMTVVCAFLSAPVFADTVQLKYISAASPNSTVTFWDPIQGKDVSETVYATDYKYALRQKTGYSYPGDLPPQNATITGFCIDVADNSPPAGQWYDYNVVSLAGAPDTWAGPMGTTRAAYLSQLLDRYWGVAGTNDTALQIAVWEIVDEGRKNNTVPALGSFNIANGTFKATDPTGKAQGYLSSLTANWTPLHEYAALTNNTYQDFIVAVPVPAAALLGLLGLSAAGLRLRRFA